MKKTILIIVLLVALLSGIIIEKNWKTDVYITLQDIEGYNFQFNDSIAQKISKIEISQMGELSYQRWEIVVDSTKTEKTNKENLVSHITCSPDFIVNNFGWNSDLIADSKRFRLYIIMWDKDEPFILPIQDIHFIVE